MANFQYTVQGIDYDVDIIEVNGTLAKVSVNGIEFEVELKQPISVGSNVSLKKAEAKPQPAKVEGTVEKQETPVVKAGEGTKVCSPLPGTITAINVKVGETVAIGDTIVVLEAMKMQNNIEAENSGTITSIMVNVGDSVMEGTVLVTIA